MWEDEGNKNGGKFSVKVKKDFTTIIWEELVNITKYNIIINLSQILLFIGGTLPDNIKEEVNGIVVSVRREFNIIQVWFRNYKENAVLYDLEYILYFK